ncbi:brassinosteroid-responsive RING protein 1-like [Diospyros lotus]|uniref:brassinosteroid-responsive RING protein 1-like n=1 Tax=Diospyros lotus TaxID=55363 RepID=UPI002251A20E|nr:brassinosteroid-responsive RING protein 1-like [Diospyros lotus]
MGFPVGYNDLIFPKLFLHALSLLAFLRNFVFSLSRSLGFRHFPHPDVDSLPARPGGDPAALIRDLLPVLKFSEVEDPPESCAVCLYEFEGGDEVRRLPNCRHIFHRSCLDPWMDHLRWTCPLCRTQLLPGDLQAAFDERLSPASWISGFHGEYSPVTSSGF